MSNFKGTVINFADITPEAIGALDTMLLTRAEYDALESKSEDILYIITDEVDDKDLDIHIKDTNVHVSAEEKEKWNNPPNPEISATTFQGVLPIEKGGTGANNANDAKANLGIGSSNKISPYSSDFYLMITGQHPVFMGGIYAHSTKKHTHAARAISLSGNAETITVYDGVPK